MYKRPKPETSIVAEATRRSMRGNTAKETGPERTLRRALWQAGLRGYRKNVKALPGKPDVVYGPKRLAIFVHGCFWHGCTMCTRNLKPKQNGVYWKEKIEANRARDARSREQLESLGYQVLTIWECQLSKDLSGQIEAIQAALDKR